MDYEERVQEHLDEIRRLEERMAQLPDGEDGRTRGRELAEMIQDEAVRLGETKAEAGRLNRRHH